MKKKLIIAAFVTLMIYTYGKITAKDPLQPQIADKILRFHVLANSDKKEDQDVKLMVRDAVGEYVESLLVGMESRADTEKIIEKNMDKIVAIADEVLDDNSMDYCASAKLVNTEFPVKTYGKYTFPKGQYRALQIKLGNAKGHNWWCVLFPNLCFRGTMYENVSDDADEELKEVLSVDEYKDVIESGDFTVKFKILEYLPFKR